MSLLAAYLHHFAAFSILSILLVELVLLHQTFDLKTAKTLRLIDGFYGLFAGLIVAVGIWRVMSFEKGQEYYLHSHVFWAKMVVFALVGLLSIYPTIVFLKWGKEIKNAQIPVFSDVQRTRIVLLLKLEVAGIAAILLFAAMLAKGF